MSNKTISVVMPVYNAEKHLKAAIDSLLNQTFADFEILVIDDGSTDGTAQILDRYHDSRIVRVKNDVNMGIVATMNRGLEMAQGKYIARMDADDIAHPDRFKQQVAFLERHPDVGLIGTRYRIIDDNGIPIYPEASPPPIVPNTLTMLKWSLLWMTSVQHPTAMIRRDVLERYGLRYDQAFFTAEDYDLWTRISHHAKVARLPDVLLEYRMNPDGISLTKREKQLNTHFQVTYREVCRFMGETLSDELMRFLFYVVIPQPQNPLTMMDSPDLVGSLALYVRIREKFCQTARLNVDEWRYFDFELRRIVYKFLDYSRQLPDSRQRRALRAFIFRKFPRIFTGLMLEFLTSRLRRLG